METRVGNLSGAGPEHVQLSGKEEAFSERMEESKGGVNKETGESGKEMWWEKSRNAYWRKKFKQHLTRKRWFVR